MLAVPEHQGRVSPVFDTCRTIWVFDLRDGGTLPQRKKSCESLNEEGRPKLLKELGVSLLICGAISGWMIVQLEGLGIRVIPWRSGEVREVVKAFLSGCLEEDRFAMPGCHRRRQCKQRVQGTKNIQGSDQEDPFEN